MTQCNKSFVVVYLSLDLPSLSLFSSSVMGVNKRTQSKVVSARPYTVTKFKLVDEHSS